MDVDLLKKFNAELATLLDSRNLSKQKIQDITNAAIKAQKQYKHVVFGLEKLITKCKPEQRLHVLYVIDNVVRSSKHQLKERDTFGPRFMKQWDKFMEPLLKCSQREKLKIVRTLNLWLSNKVFTEAEMRPIREKCQQAGLPIDFEEVETLVKGKNADMNIYSGTYRKKSRNSGRHHRSHTPPNPPPDDGLLGAGPSTSFKSGPDIPNFVLSEELVNGTISEREMLEMIQKFGIDRAGILTKDRTLLQKVLQTFVGSLSQKITEVQSERNKANGSSIQNVLTKDFEYSDDEEEKEKEAEKEEQKKLNHDEILGLAQTMFTQPAVLSKITEVFATAVNPFGLPLVPENMIPTSSAAMSLGAPQNLMTLQQALPPGFANQQLGIPNLSGLNAQILNPQNAQAALLLQQRAAQLQALQGNAANQRMLGNLMLGNPLLNPFALQAGVNPLLSELQAVAAQQAMLNDVENPENKLLEAMNNNEMERARKDKEKERERRKMGLPAVKFGVTIIASRTLWLKKIPTNVVENDLKQAVEKCGEATRVKVIGNRACAFITMETRKAANEVIQKLRHVSVAKKEVKVYWARSPGMDSEQFASLWDSNRGVWEVPYEKLPADLVAFCEGAMLDLESLPDDKKSLYKENGESVIAIPPPSMQPPVPQPPPMGFPFHPQLGQLQGQPRPPGLPPGVPSMFQINLNAPPPPGMHGYQPAPPPPGVGPPHIVPPPGFDPNKPPPMFQQGFNPNAPPPPFGRGAGPMPPFPPRGGMHGPPPSFRGGRGHNGPPPPHFDSQRRGGPPFRPENGRGRLPDQGEMWNREREQRGRDRDYDRERDRSQIDRRRNDDVPRRRSRWGDDERHDDRHEDRHEDRRDDRRERRRSPRSPERRLRRSPSYERNDSRELPVKKSSVSAEEATVSSTTLDEMKEPVSMPEPEAVPSAQEPEAAKQQISDISADHREDQTDEVPMDLE